MIVTCPECAARYRLADGAIPPEGRAMRCASCKHRWFELPLEDDAPAPPVTAVAWAPDAVAPDAPIGIVIAPREAVAAVRGEGPAIDPLDAPTPAQAAWTPSIDAPDTPRAAPVLKTLFAVGLALALTGGAVAMWLPDLPPFDTGRVPWLDTLLNPAARPASPLKLSVAVERQPLGDGRTVFALSGTVANPTATAEALGGIEGRLLTARGQVA